MDIFVSTFNMTAPQRASLIVRDNQVTGNQTTTDDPINSAAFGGGGILATFESLSSDSANMEFAIRDNRISQNTAAVFGGGVSLFAIADAEPNDDGNVADAIATVDFRNNRVTQNSASSAVVNATGGGIFAFLEAQGPATATVDMKLNTVSGNTLDNNAEPGGIHAESLTSADSVQAVDGTATLLLDSSIVSGNDGVGLGGPSPGTEGVITGGGTGNFSAVTAYSDFFGQTPDLDAWIIQDVGTLFVDPMLDPVTFVPMTCSPTIDAADPSEDFSQEPGPNGGRANMGHTGGTSEAATSLADVNGDGLIDGYEVVRISVAFGVMSDQEPRYDAGVDFNGDGMITGDDLALIAADFGVTCP
jgi:hypothetical protein